MGRYVGGVGELNINGGTFAQSNAANLLIIGEEGTGTLNLNSGAVNVTGGLRIGHLATGNGTVNLNGGTLATPNVLKTVAGSTATWKFNGGTLKTTADSTDFLQGIPAASISVATGGAIIDTDGHTVTITQALAAANSSIGSLTKQGNGVLTLPGLQTYDTLNANAGTTNLKNTLGTGTSTINVSGILNTNTSQTLAVLNITDGGIFTLDSALPAPAPAPAPAEGGVDFGGADATSTQLAAGTAAVPEPGSLSLLALGALALLRRRR